MRIPISWMRYGTYEELKKYRERNDADGGGEYSVQVPATE